MNVQQSKLSEPTWLFQFPLKIEMHTRGKMFGYKYWHHEFVSTSIWSTGTIHFQTFHRYTITQHKYHSYDNSSQVFVIFSEWKIQGKSTLSIL